jgi:hypothetical protein
LLRSRVATGGRRVGYELGTTNRHRLVAVDAPVGGPSDQFVAAEIMHDDGYGRGRGTERGSAIAQTELRAGRLVLRPMVLALSGCFVITLPIGWLRR